MRTNKKIWLLALGFLSACSSPEYDHSTNFAPLVYDTKVNVSPITQAERDRLQDVENFRYKKNITPMLEQYKHLQEQHDAYYAQLKKSFPECDLQKYCDSDIFRGDITKITNYNRMVVDLKRFDLQFIDLNRDIANEKARHDFELRRIYNRYLVSELLKVNSVYPYFYRFLVQSIEGYNAKSEIQKRLYQFADNIDPKYLEDYDFSMYGKKVDEAAIILTVDIIPFYPGKEEPYGSRFLVSFLINTQNLDKQYYENDFLHDWATELWSLDRKRIKLESYCGMFALSSDSLAKRFSAYKKEHCASYREENRHPPGIDPAFNNHFEVREWLLPIAYVEYKSALDPK